jgi:hypothetical protein
MAGMSKATEVGRKAERKEATLPATVTRTVAIVWAVVALIAGSVATAGFNYLAERRQAAREDSVRLTTEERDRRQSLRLVSDELQVNAFNLKDLDCACLPGEARTREAQMRALDEFFPDAAWTEEKRMLARYLTTELWGKSVFFYGALDSLKEEITIRAKPSRVFPPSLQRHIRALAPLASSLYQEINRSIGDSELDWAS